MSEQQPEVQPGSGTGAAEENGFADSARAAGGTPEGLESVQDPAQPADESSSPA